MTSREMAERIVGIAFKDLVEMLTEMFDALPREDVRPLEGLDRHCADCLAAAVDVAVRNNSIDSRSLIADARLDYGDPFGVHEADSLVYRGKRRRDSDQISVRDARPERWVQNVDE